jgi:monoamine oxidase
MARSFHSPLTAVLREAQAACAQAEASGAPIDEISDRRARARGSPPRRALLIGALAATGLAAAPRRARAVGGPRIVIVGAGLAGLSCAQRLWTGRGLASTIYEGSDVVGGRVRSLRGYFANGEIGELHGEFISSEHRRMLALARTYGLSLKNTNFSLGEDSDTYWFDGARLTQDSLNRAWREGLYELFRDAVKKAPGANYLHASPAARAWDHMSVSEWVERFVPGGTSGPLGRLCLADVLSEYGGLADEQSALNLIYLLGYDASSGSGYQSPQRPLLAGSDERWIVLGGNDQIIAGLVGELPKGSIHTGHRLLSIRPAGAGFVCTFQKGAATVDVAADQVVLAIPPTTLRQVDFSRVPLSPLKRIQIAGSQLGTNVKLLLQVSGRPWQALGYTGSQLTDQAIGGGWDASCFERGSRGPGAQSLYAAYRGGEAGADFARRYGIVADGGPATSRMVDDALAQLEPIFPGFGAAWAAGSRLAYYRDGNLDPFLMGAYAYYRVGQYTRFSGVEALPAGNLHFAGEHTSTAFQGYMEGAVQSRYRAAAELARLS